MTAPHLAFSISVLKVDPMQSRSSARNTNGWLTPMLAAALAATGIAFVGPTLLPERPRLAAPAPPKARAAFQIASNPLPIPATPQPTPGAAAVPSPESTPAPAPKEEPANIDIPSPTPAPEMKAIEEKEAARAALVETALKTIQFPPIPFTRLAFMRARIVTIKQARQAKAEASAADRGTAVEWPERMPPQLKPLVLAGTMSTQVRYFNAGESGEQAPLLDYISEAAVKRSDGKRAVARWTVTIRFFPDVAEAKKAYRDTVDDLSAPDSGLIVKPLSMGEEAAYGEYAVGTLGQREKTYVIRQGQDLLEMVVPVGAPATVNPTKIVDNLKKLRSGGSTPTD